MRSTTGVAKLNANDVVRVAKDYLTTENRVVVVTMPKTARGERGRPMMTTRGLSAPPCSPSLRSRALGHASDAVRHTVDQQQGADLERDPENQTTESGRGRPVERRPSQMLLEESVAHLGSVSANHPWRGRLLRPAQRAGLAGVRRRLVRGRASKTSTRYRSSWMAAEPYDRHRHVVAREGR